MRELILALIAPIYCFDLSYLKYLINKLKLILLFLSLDVISISLIFIYSNPKENLAEGVLCNLKFILQDIWLKLQYPKSWIRLTK